MNTINMDMADANNHQSNKRKSPPGNNSAASSQSKITCTTANYAQDASTTPTTLGNQYNPWITTNATAPTTTTAATTHLASSYTPTTTNLLRGMQPADFGFSNEQFNHILLRNSTAVERAAAFALPPASTATNSVQTAAASLTGNTALNYHLAPSIYTTAPTAATAAATGHTEPTMMNDSVFARYALRAMNGGHEPNAKEIVEFMGRMHKGASGTTTAGGVNVAPTFPNALLTTAGGTTPGFSLHNPTTTAATAPTPTSTILGNAAMLKRERSILSPPTLGGRVLAQQRQLQQQQQQQPSMMTQHLVGGVAPQSVILTQPLHQNPPPQPSVPILQQQQQQQQQRAKPRQQLFKGTSFATSKSIIPCPKKGTKEVHAKTILENIARRVQSECNTLCLLPTQEYVTTIHPTARFLTNPLEWQRCTISLIYSALNLESPNPIGWDIPSSEGDGEVVRQYNSSIANQCGRKIKLAKWCRGSYYKLSGPQPWQCTRPLILRHVYELLVAEGYEDWLISELRWRELEGVMLPLVQRNLCIWKPAIFGEGGTCSSREVVEEYSKKVWERYREEYLMSLKGGEEALVPMPIGFAYVCEVGERLDWPILRGSGGDEMAEEEVAAAEEVEDDGGGEEVDDSEAAGVTPDPEVVCLPVVQANDNDEDENFVEDSKWTCDFCSAIFSDYDEAVAHENGCKMNSNATNEEEGSEAVGASKKNEGDGFVIEEKWTCDYCGNPFRSYDEALAHEEECKKTSNVTKILDEENKGGDATSVEKSTLAQSDSPQNDNSDKENKKDVEVIVIDDECEGPEREGYLYQEKWTCDYCSASFPKYDDAVAHENICYVKVKSAADDNAAAGNENKTNDVKGVDYVMEEHWNCDFCDARFSTLDEATAHEAVCTKALEVSTSNPAVCNANGEAEHVTDFLVSDEYRSSMLKVLKKLHYEYFPLMRGGGEKLEEVCEKVLRCMHAITPLTGDFSEEDVESILNQLEYESGYLTVLNDLLRVRAKKKGLKIDKPPPKVSNPLVNVDNTPVRTQESKFAETVSHVLLVAASERNEQVTAVTMPKETETIAMKETLPKRIDTIVVEKPAPCRVCILCSAPDCERCSVCLSDYRTEIDICIRKKCCKIPFEFKAKDIPGFPHGWEYAFCDPTHRLLVKSIRQITSLAGLVLRKKLLPTSSQQIPKYQYFQSLEAAFSAVEADDSSTATTLVESFFAEIYGPDAIKSYPNHYLLGKRCCFEFTNANGRNVEIFGVIVRCFRENSEAEHDIFMVQYDSDCIKLAAKTLSTTVSQLQLISAGQAWGGCISFEKKTYIRVHPSVCSTVDQSTAVEYWVTPSMRMEELVEQPNGVKTPQLTIFLRGYKLVFASNTQGSSVFVTCTSMCATEGEGDESVLKPGELIDLGVVSPLIDTDTKLLSVFIVKNYIHNFTINSYVEDGNGYVHDLTNAATGLMHLVAAKKVLSYVQNCSETETPTIHYGRDPSGKIHLLFGLQYMGDWTEYSNSMEKEMQPIFRGLRKEVTLSHNDVVGEDREEKYLSAMSNFGPHELEQCSRFLRTLSLKASTGALSSEVKTRFARVGALLRNRIAELENISMGEVDKRIRVSIDQLNVS